MFKPAALLLVASLAVSQRTDINGCLGVWFVDTQYRDGACCIGGTMTAPYLSVCAGWPICSGPATTTHSREPLSCATVIASDDDYSSNLAAATSSLSASGTNFETTFMVGNEGAAATGAASIATSSESATASDTAGSATSATGDNSGPASTMAGVGAVGGAVLLLAALL